MSEYQAKVLGQSTGAGAMSAWQRLTTEQRADTLRNIVHTTRADANSALFLARELEHVESKALVVDYEDLLARVNIPASEGVPVGARSVSYNQYDINGEAKVIGDAADDLPRADVVKENFLRPVLELGTSIAWSVNELEAAAFARESLEEWKMKAAREACEQLIDNIACFGSNGFTGMLNDANVGTTALGAAWSVARAPAAKVMDDLNRLVQATADSSKYKKIANTARLPSTEYAYAAQLHIPNTNETVLSFWTRTNPYVKDVEAWPVLETSASGSAKQIVVYRKEQEVLDLVIPLDFASLPPQPKGLEYIVPCRALTAGCRIRKPFAMRYGSFS